MYFRTSEPLRDAWWTVSHWPCCLHCCPPWCYSCPSSFWAQSPQTSHPSRWEAHPRLLRQKVGVIWTEQMGSQVRLYVHDLAVPCEVSMTTSTFLKIPRRKSRCRASWDFCITCAAKHSLNNSDCLPIAVSAMRTYINQVLGLEYSRDFMSEQIILGSTESINVHPLNYDLTQEKQMTTSTIYEWLCLSSI